MYDNSIEADPALKLVLHMERGKILNASRLQHTPDWAKPVVAAALKLRGGKLRAAKS